MRLTAEQIDEICATYAKTNNEVETAKATNHSPATVSKYLILRGKGRGTGGNQDSQRKVTDAQILADIEEGLTRQEIADKRGVHVENLARRMRKLGVHARYAKPRQKPRQCQEPIWRYNKSHARLINTNHSEFDYVESKKRKIRLRCRRCGAILEREVSCVRRYKTTCEACKERDKEREKQDKARTDMARFLYVLKEYKTPKTCFCCGREFFSCYSTATYCSETCKRKAKRNRVKERDPGKYKARKHKQAHKYIQRAKKYGCFYEYGITRIKVVERDNNVCQICGKVCNPLDKTWGSFGPDFPTLDHIIPLSKGGAHSWDNVQCACGNCNSHKRNLITV